MQTWQDKLRVLSDAQARGYAFSEYGLYFSPPVDPRQVERIMSELARDIDTDAHEIESLYELYTFTDGVTFPTCTVLSITSTYDGTGRAGSAGSLQEYNRENLSSIRNRALDIADDSSTLMQLSLAFALDDVGDPFCLTKDGTVVLVGLDAWHISTVASSLDDFLSDVCMGSGYPRYFHLSEEAARRDDYYVFLESLGFLN
jgi:hypothetical protein